MTHTEREIDEAARRLVEQEIYCCDSALVDALLKRGDIAGFGFDDIEGEYPDPSDWDREQCLQFAQDELGTQPPDTDDIDELRDWIRSEAEPREIYEWWRVSPWLLERLREAGEPILDNDYGEWWGRTCTGQSIAMDYVIRKIAQEQLL